jgi:hypothetical protein
MNIFIGVGTIIDVQTNGKVMKFNLSIQQEKPCIIPCVVFDPADEIKKFITDVKSTAQVVWMQGKISSSEYDYNGKTVRKITVVPFVKSIRVIQ